MNSELLERAFANFAALKANRYPGRVIVLGITPDGRHLVQIYAIMGRSPSSRSRVFELDDADSTVKTSPLDMTQTIDPLTIYNAMMELGDSYVVSNGCQTDSIIMALNNQQTLALGLRDHVYEPDPSSTPRISGIWFNGAIPVAEIAILRRSVFGRGCDRIFYRFDHVAAGSGYFVSTYAHDGNPLPAFNGEPRIFPIQNGIDEVVNEYWDHLDPENRVSLAVKFINRESGASETKIVNKYEKIPAPAS
jgi:IMP cyclohydrolase